MKLSFLILFLLVLSGAGESPEPSQKSQEIRPDKHQEASKNVKAPTKQQPEQPTPFQTEILRAIRAMTNEIKTTYEQYDTSQKSWNSPTVLIQIGLLIVGAAYTVFACKQWQAIRRQANLMAQLERPWLIMEQETPDGWDAIMRLQMPPSGRINVKWSAVNRGRSPAFLVQLFRDVVIVPIPTSDARPVYGEPEPFPDLVVAPNRAHGGEESRIITSDEFDEIILGRSCLMFYGFMRYYDSLREDIHETRFCCYWHRDQIVTPQGVTRWKFEPVGPRSYIEYT